MITAAVNMKVGVIQVSLVGSASDPNFHVNLPELIIR